MRVPGSLYIPSIHTFCVVCCACSETGYHATTVLSHADNGNNYYFAFGGCHRWAAVKQLGLPTIRARLIKVSPSAIDTYLGASSPFRKNRPAAAATANVVADSVSTPNAAAAVDKPS